MRPALSLLLVACVAALAATPVAADVVPGTPTPETEIRNVLGRWDRARAQHDVAVLAELLDEAFVAAGTGGEQLSRADLLAGRAPERGARLITRDDLRVNVH